MNCGIKWNEWGGECRKRGREVKKRERCFTLLPSLLHPVLINTEALKEMSAWTRCVCVHIIYIYTKVCMYVCMYMHEGLNIYARNKAEKDGGICKTDMKFHQTERHKTQERTATEQT